MKLALDGPQTLLAQAATDFCAGIEPVDRLRRLRDAGDDLAYSPDVWRQMAELGWTGISVPEEEGGLGMGLAELILITEAMGRGLAPEPLISATAVCGRLLARAGTAAQKEAHLPKLFEGSGRLALAAHERRYDLSDVGVTATADGDGWVVSGTKPHVIDGYGADGFLVSARTAQGITVFLLSAERSGVEVRRQSRVDSRNAAIVQLSDVKAGSDDVVGAIGGGSEILEEAVDAGTVALCGEMVGLMSEAFERTLSYLKEREQFGVLIGTFQALKHRAAQLFIEIELSRSAAMAAARAVDEGSEDARIEVSNAKARCSDAVIQVTNEALQMHGGIGMTDEHDIGLFMKRARVCELTFGDSDYHRQRYASLRGF